MNLWNAFEYKQENSASNAHAYAYIVSSVILQKYFSILVLKYNLLCAIYHLHSVYICSSEGSDSDSK